LWCRELSHPHFLRWGHPKQKGPPFLTGPWVSLNINWGTNEPNFAY